MTLIEGSWVSVMDPLFFYNMVWKAAQRFGEISYEREIKNSSMSDLQVSQVPTWEIRWLLRWFFVLWD